MNSPTHKRAQAALAARTARDLARLWKRVDLNRLAETWPAFEKAALLLIQQRGRVSAGVAHAYYRAARRSAGIPGEPPPLKSTPTTAEIVGGLLVMGLWNSERQLELGRAADDVARTSLVNVTGVTTKYVLDHGRDALLNAVKDDPEARGWKRETSGSACTFCAMLAGRTYRAEQSASFESHRHCACTPTPVFA